MGENGNGVCAPPQGAQELLQEFQQTGREEPFEEIARRYAGMVYNVALQVTRDAHDAEDATQATFLTLAVHAKTAGKIRYVGPWLRKVSHRLALDIRRSKKRRKAREEKHANGNGHANGHSLPVSADMHMEELRQILREELDKLPSKYRMPLILYYFGGLAPEEMGKELNCNTSTLGVRLHRGRKMLADSLSGRGISISSTMLGALLAGLVGTFVTDSLVRSSTRAAAHVAANGFVLHACAPMNVAALVRSATSALAWGRLKVAVGTALLIASSLAGGTEVLRRLDVINPYILRDFNPMNWVRPLMDKLLSGPRLTVQNDTADLRGDLAIDADAFSFDQQFTLNPVLPGSTYPADFVSHPIQHIAGAVVTVESQRTMASQLQLGIQPVAVIAPSLASLPVTPKPALLTLSPSPLTDTAQAAVTSQGSATLIVDRALQNDGRPLHVSGGSNRVGTLVVGDGSVGHVVHTGGQMQVSESLVIARRPGSVGTYSMSGGELLAANMTVGADGEGRFEQRNGSVRVTASASNDPNGTSDSSLGILSIGDGPGSVGNYSLDGGTLYADTILIGREGTGTLRQTDGLASFKFARLGSERIGDGTWDFTGGQIEVASAQGSSFDGSSAAIVVGGDGWGTFLLRSDSQFAAIKEQPGAGGSSLVVRAHDNAQGVVRGHGNIGLSGRLEVNGKVIADGSGKTRVLDLTSVSSVTNSIENPRDGGTNGFFARNGGKLVLPAIDVDADGTYTWGEDPLDPVIDLVNSVRITPRNVTKPGTIRISLLDPRSSETPAMPDGIEPLSIWALDNAADYEGIDLMVRYDDVQAALWGMAESDLTLWVYEQGWHPIAGQSLSQDLGNHLLSGTASNPTFFATAPIPEPSTLVIGALAAGTLLLRRRRGA